MAAPIGVLEPVPGAPMAALTSSHTVFWSQFVAPQLKATNKGCLERSYDNVSAETKGVRFEDLTTKILLAEKCELGGYGQDGGAAREDCASVRRNS